MTRFDERLVEQPGGIEKLLERASRDRVGLLVCIIGNTQVVNGSRSTFMAVHARFIPISSSTVSIPTKTSCES